MRTWCRGRDLDYLWPQLWLPHELPTARILTFGYNTHFAAKKEQSSHTIGDFATDLLFRMKYGENTPERLGQVPIVVVAHSMGGLVFKKAFLQGHQNSEFREIVSTIKAVLFLATPHRGTDLADTLNKLLSSSVFGHSPKEYVTELARRSPTIDDLNEAFRHHASKLQIFSFYETLSTAVGPVSVMILDKSTAVMGYPGETATPLTANHHDVCKFTSTQDPNYTSVIGALRSVTASVASPVEDHMASQQEIQHLVDFLGVASAPEEEFATRRSVRKQGTCEGFLKSEVVDSWLHSECRLLLWAHAPPGSGKSTTCSFAIEQLLGAGQHCSYFFFRHGQRHKQSPSSMLRSLAYQTALQMPAYRKALVDLASSGTDISTKDGPTLWKKLFAGVLGTIRGQEDIYWVIDGLDESDSSKQVIELLSGTADFKVHARILVFSRRLASISQAFQLARKKLPVIEMALPDNRNDIRSMVAGEIDYLLSGDEFKAEVVREITARSQGNFLWASLVTTHVLKCRREDQVKQVLDTTPDGMERLYDRMTDAITGLDDTKDKALAKILLTWAMYAKTPITVEELSEVHATELKSIMDLGHAISHVCGQFVVVNPQGRVTLVHHSAREYLGKTRRCPFSLQPQDGHEELFGKCIVTLCDKGLRRKINTLKVPQFLPYASTSWSDHLEGCSPSSDRILDALVRFFSGPYPLAWIQYLAMSSRLSELFGASRKLTAYVRKRKKVDADTSPLLHRLTDLSLLETWAVDMMKLPAKFGRHLSDDPSLIYKCIPALSPTSTVIHQKFAENPAAALSVIGLSNEDWDDCLARVSGSVGRALRLAASPLFLAVASDAPRGTITTWDTDLFSERKTFCLNEHIWCLDFSKSGSHLACYALSQTHVWRTTDWSLELSVDNPRQERAIEFKFDESDTLVMVSEQRRVYKLFTQRAQTPSWEQLDHGLLEEPGVPEGTFLSTPSCVAFNNDCTQIAVAYRLFPVSIWSIDPPEMMARLRRKPGPGRGAAKSYTGDHKVVWHPSGTHVVGINGQIFKWSPVDDTYEEVKGETGVIPHGLLCSPNGQVFITMDVGGSIRIYDFSSMSLLYKLTSEDRINQICFSPDNIRFYDLRGSYCNIWEPNCLIRLADAASEQQISDTDSAEDSFWSDTEDTHSTSISFPVSEGHVDSKPAITAFEPGRRSHEPIAHANEDGSIHVYDTLGKRKHELCKTMFKMTVEHLVWNPKHDQLAYSLASGAVTVFSVTIDAVARTSVLAEKIYSEKRSPTDRGRTSQLLFDPTGTRLLTYGTKKCHVLSLPDGAVLAEHSVQDGGSAKWLQHPFDPDRLLRFTEQTITVFNWKDLEQETSLPLNLPNPDGASPPTIDAILDSHDTRVLLLRTVAIRLNRPRYSFVIIPTEDLCAPTSDLSSMPTPQPAIAPLVLPRSLVSAVAHAVGILPDGRLVFLDRRLWVCTIAILAPPSPTFTRAAPRKLPELVIKQDVTRHFFLPHDWVTAQGLRLCRLLRDGAFLCPSKGEVAVMKGDLVRDW